MTDTRILFIGDVVGRAGRTALEEYLPELTESARPDVVIVNGENAAGGFGITEAIFESFMDLGVDCVTLGNHSFDQREALVFIDRHERLIRPLNMPSGVPGRGVAMIEARNDARVLVINGMGRIFMQPIDDPFAALADEIASCPLGRGAEPAEVSAMVLFLASDESSYCTGSEFIVDGGLLSGVPHRTF